MKRVQEILEKIKKEKRVSPEIAAELKQLFGKRFDKALELALERGVKKYVHRVTGRTLHVVVGREGEYEVIPVVPFCECQDFLKNALAGADHVCYHILAQWLAEALELEDVFMVGEA